MFKYSAFSFAVADSLGETLLAYSLIAARRAVLTYDFLTSANAIKTYRWLAAMPVALGQLTFWSIVWAYAQAKTWAKAEVEACLPSPAAKKFLNTVDVMFTEADDLPGMWEPSDFDSPDFRLPADDDALEAEFNLCFDIQPLTRLGRANELNGLNLKSDLVPLAKSLGLKTNKVRKADLVSAILDAEGYTEQGAVTPATTEEE